MQAEGEVADFGICGIIERHDLHGVAVALVYSGEALHSFRRTTTGGPDGSDDVKEFHGRRGWGESLHGLYLSEHSAGLIVSLAGRVMNPKYPNGIMRDGCIGCSGALNGAGSVNKMNDEENRK
jgi:hypothetical protein